MGSNFLPISDTQNMKYLIEIKIKIVESRYKLITLL